MSIWKRLPIGLLLIPGIVKAQTLPTVPIYSFSAVNGYASNGNVTNYTDSVTGTWNLGYDDLNRLTSGTVTPVVNQNQYFCWGYDSFGNRKIQAGSNQPFQTGSPTCQPVSSANISNNIASYDNANRITSTNANGVVIPPGYDAAGNLTDDGINQVLFDAENRVCAVFNRNTNGITQYIYDAEGRRVAKGHPANGNTLYCPTGPGDFIPDETYVVGQSGEQVSKLDSTGQWLHSNVYAGGQLLATYSQNGSAQPLHFNVTDHLGSKRVQTTAGGAVELTCLNLPFGDGLTCTGPGTDASEHHFTGKERDQETKLDYFGARHYSSTMGRFMSPDDFGGHTENPQTLNKYAYAGNNPLTNTDPTGHDFWQSCDKASSTCQNQQIGTDKNGNAINHLVLGTTDSNGKFTAGVVTSASLSDPNSGNSAVVNGTGVQITSAAGTAQGIFINGTPSADIQGQGAGFNQFSFHIDSSDAAHGVLTAGTANYTGSGGYQGMLDAIKNTTVNGHGPFQYTEEKLFGNPYHKGEQNFRFSTGAYPELFNYGPSPHFAVPQGPNPSSDFHIDSKTGPAHLTCATMGAGCY